MAGLCQSVGLAWLVYVNLWAYGMASKLLLVMGVALLQIGANGEEGNTVPSLTEVKIKHLIDMLRDGFIRSLKQFNEAIRRHPPKV